MSYAYATFNVSSFSTGWAKLLSSSQTLSNISGLAYFANGDFSLPAGTYFILGNLNNGGSTTAYGWGIQSSETPVIPTSTTTPGLDCFRNCTNLNTDCATTIQWCYTFTSNNFLRFYIYNTTASTVYTTPCNVTFIKIT